MFKALVSVVLLFFVVGCAQVPREQGMNTYNMCDRSLAWKYVAPEPDVPDSMRDLLGIWKGEVMFPGGGTMCIGVVLKDVKASGDVDAIFVWNLSGQSSQTVEVYNVHSEGTSNWWAKNVEVDPVTKRMEVLFDAKEPFNGRMYKYRFNPPTNGVMNGVLWSQNVSDGNEASQPATLTRVQ